MKENGQLVRPASIPLPKSHMLRILFYLVVGGGGGGGGCKEVLTTHDGLVS
jgi:hypothetical protein